MEYSEKSYPETSFIAETKTNICSSVINVCLKNSSSNAKIQNNFYFNTNLIEKTKFRPGAAIAVP